MPGRIVVTICLTAVFVSGMASAGSAAPQYRPQCFGAGACGQLSDQGNRVIFPFQDMLLEIPAEEPFQIYEWANGEVKPIIRFPSENSNSENQAELQGISRDGKRVFFEASGRLVPSDANRQTDVYETSDGNLRIRTAEGEQTGRFSGSGTFSDNSPDGNDIFAWTSSSDSPNLCSSIFRLNSDGPEEVAAGELWNAFSFINPEMNCESPTYAGISGDGEHVYYHMSDIEPYWMLDTIVGGQPGCQLIHEVTESGSRVVSNFHLPLERNEFCGGYEFGDASYDGSSMLFLTYEPLDPADPDDRGDMYVSSPGGEPQLVSPGPKLPPEPFLPASYEEPIAISGDGSRAVFVTSHPLDPADLDQAQDIYATQVGGSPRLISTGPVDSHENVRIPTTHAISQWLVDVSQDARTVAFETDQRLTASDLDESSDVYISRDGQISLVSITGYAGNGPAKARMVGLSGSGDSVAYLTRERMTENDLDRNGTDYFLRTFDSTEASVSTGGSANRRAEGRKARTRLVSEETSPPEMKLGKRLKLDRARSVAIRISCPKAEVNGPCAGKVTITNDRRKNIRGTGRFRVPAGKSRRLVVKLSRLQSLQLGSGAARSFKVRIKARDQVGNLSVDLKSRRLGS